MKTLHDKGARRILWEYAVYLDLFAELFPFLFSWLRDLDRNARVDLVNERDASFPDPVDTRELVFDIHDENIMCNLTVWRAGQKQVFPVIQGEVSRGEKQGQAQLNHEPMMMTPAFHRPSPV